MVSFRYEAARLWNPLDPRFKDVDILSGRAWNVVRGHCKCNGMLFADVARARL